MAKFEWKNEELDDDEVDSSPEKLEKDEQEDEDEDLADSEENQSF
ncbi:MAG: hypothetical protein V1906_00655 [Candidatus Woesearchaeota archaeon]